MRSRFRERSGAQLTHRSARMKPLNRILSRVVLASVALAPCSAAAAQICDVTIAVDGTGSLGGLEMRIGYGSADGAFVGSGDAVSCTGLADGAYQSARHDTIAESLDLGLLSVIGVPLPGDFWRCQFQSNSAVPTANQFSVTIDESMDPQLAPLAVTGHVSAIFCSQQAVCGNGVVEGTEECDTGAASVACTSGCKLTRNSQRCRVRFRVSGATPLGGLQFWVNYAAANGDFEGTGASVSCSEALASSLTAVLDRDADHELRLGLISPGAIPLPADLWECSFLTNASPLQLGSMQIQNVIATNVEAKVVSASVVPISDGCINGPYCGDGHLDAGEACDDGNQIGTDACTNGCTVAACGDGIVRAGVEQCDDGNLAAGDCCSACSFEAATTVCRGATGICDLAENCTGASGACPTDLKKTTVCRAPAGVCDLAEVCSGSANDCPTDLKSTSVCRASTGLCDLTESCNGVAGGCPADAFQPATTACTSDDNACTDDKCDGAGTCAHSNNTLACDDGLYCNGGDSCSSGTCSQHTGNPCPGADGDGDCTESCLEAQDNCNGNDPDQAICNDGNAATFNDRCSSGLCVGSTSNVICGDADANGVVNATDALKVLRTAVGQVGVSCPLYLCDTDKNGLVQAGDSLRVLKKAVGQPTDLQCPPAP